MKAELIMERGNVGKVARSAILPGSVWSSVVVIEALRRAFEVMARLPIRHGPRGNGAAWPDVVRSASEAYGYHAAVAPPVQPSSRAISEAERVMGWLVLIPSVEDRYLVSARAVRKSWRELSERYRVSDRQLRRRHAAVIRALVLTLNAQ